MVKTCRRCKTEKPETDFYNRPGYSSKISWCKACFNSYCVDRWVKVKVDIIMQKGGRCANCALTLADSHYSVFELHHRNPRHKEVSKTSYAHWGKTRLTKELEKCVILCANCHRLHHAGVLQNPALVQDTDAAGFEPAISAPITIPPVRTRGRLRAQKTMRPTGLEPVPLSGPALRLA